MFLALKWQSQWFQRIESMQSFTVISNFEILFFLLLTYTTHFWMIGSIELFVGLCWSNLVNQIKGIIWIPRNRKTSQRFPKNNGSLKTKAKNDNRLFPFNIFYYLNSMNRWKKRVNFINIFLIFFSNNYLFSFLSNEWFFQHQITNHLQQFNPSKPSFNLKWSIEIYYFFWLFPKNQREKKRATCLGFFVSFS